MVVYIQRMLEKMKDKNGYTLGEVLAVITILSIIIILLSKEKGKSIEEILEMDIKILPLLIV